METRLGECVSLSLVCSRAQANQASALWCLHHENCALFCFDCYLSFFFLLLLLFFFFLSSEINCSSVLANAVYCKLYHHLAGTWVKHYLLIWCSPLLARIMLVIRLTSVASGKSLALQILNNLQCVIYFSRLEDDWKTWHGGRKTECLLSSEDTFTEICLFSLFWKKIIILLLFFWPSPSSFIVHHKTSSALAKINLK